MMINETFKRLLWLFWAEILYLTISIVFLIKLDGLNEILLNRHLDPHSYLDAVELLSFSDYAAVKYFAVTIILAIIGCLLIIRKYRHMKYHQMEFVEILLSIIAIVIIIGILILLWIFIDNPIVRAVITILALGSVIGMANS